MSDTKDIMSTVSGAGLAEHLEYHLVAKMQPGQSRIALEEACRRLRYADAVQALVDVDPSGAGIAGSIIDALDAYANGYDRNNENKLLKPFIRAATARYKELRMKMGFGEASKISRTEMVSAMLSSVSKAKS